jgi:uncharacterized protein (DUF58 family)
MANKSTRKLRLTTSGKWYIALTIGLGVTAMLAEINALYLIESLLLSGLILSGILSERTVHAVHVEIRRNRVSAKLPAQDTVIVVNKKKFPIFCVEIGEWTQGKQKTIAYIPYIGPLSKIAIKSKQAYSMRGLHHWEGIAIATSYPLGLARKINIHINSGKRIVWPELLTHSSKNRTTHPENSARIGSIFSEGEIRSKTYEDDARMIVWPLSAKGSDPVVRVRRNESRSAHLVLDLRTISGEAFEKAVQVTALPFHKLDLNSEGGVLQVISTSGRTVIRGKREILDYLATVQPTESKKAVA